MQFTNDELKNILALIDQAPIKGSGAITVALLIQKINNILNTSTDGTISKEQGELEKSDK